MKINCVHRTGLTLALALVFCALFACGQSDAQSEKAQATAPARPEPVSPVRIGEMFPPAVLNLLNPGAGGATQVDLDGVLGKKGVVFFYWIAGLPRADQGLQELQALAEELDASKIAVYALTFPQPGRDEPVIRQRASELGLNLPILIDDGFRLGQQLQVSSSPYIGVIDAEGHLRLGNASVLQQDVEYKLDVGGVIRRVAETGKTGSHGHLARYYPVTELVGKECPDFKAPLITTKVDQRWHNLIDDKSINVLIFWSVDCPHCRTSLPEINTWIQQNSEGVNVYTAARVTNDAVQTKTEEFCRLNGLSFPTLVDKDMQVANLFQITSTPTIVIMGPDGVIDSVLLSPTADFGATIEAKKRELL